MKITKIEPYIVKVPPPYYGGLYWFFVKITTDEGVYGWGETATLHVYYPLIKSYKSLLNEIFEFYLKGQDPLDRERINKTLYNGITFRHTEYSTSGLISAIDTALWDIAGKLCNQPVYNLLGGAFREKIRSYSYIYDVKSGKARSREKDWFDVKNVAENALQMAEEGFTALKLDPVPLIHEESFSKLAESKKLHGQEGLQYLNYPYSSFYLNPFNMRAEHYKQVDEICSAIRNAIGYGVDLLIGTHGQITTSSAIRLAKVLEKYDPLWFEEPVPPENTKEMAKVARSTSVPIATGERLSTVFDFTRLLEDGAASILQPDLGSCGGITECKKIASIAEGYYAQLAPHVWGGPVITAAALQIDACIPNFLIQESIYKGGGFFNEIVVEPLSWEKGYYMVPKTPGIGIDLNTTALKKYGV